MFIWLCLSLQFFSSIAMSQSPILPQLRLGWSSPKRSLCSSPRSAAPSSRNPGIQNIRRKRMDGLASKHTGCNINECWQWPFQFPWLPGRAGPASASTPRRPSNPGQMLMLIDADLCWLMIVSHRSLDNWVTFLFWQSSKLIEPVLEKSLPNPWWMTSVVNHSANDRERMSKMLRSAASHALLQCTTMHHYNPSLQPATILQYTTYTTIQ